ncbi:S9 family peptidase, partial [Mycolicibacterium farcinogenes]|nr:S9 family peptidase [Mycolicibacterium farcinogenes]
MTVFDDLDQYLALPRISGLAVSPDGSRVVTTVSTLDDNGTEFVSAIWELDPSGTDPARRLTYGVKGESAPVFTACGDLLFLAVRPGDDEDKPPAALWRLPAAGGEAHEFLAMPGGVTGAASARAAEVTVAAAPVLPSSSGVDDDKAAREARKKNKVSAILHTGYPVRHWDHDLGPDQPHLFDADGPRDLTTEPGAALRETTFDLSADGDFVVTSWRVAGPGAGVRLV